MICELYITNLLADFSRTINIQKIFQRVIMQRYSGRFSISSSSTPDPQQQQLSPLFLGAIVHTLETRQQNIALHIVSGECSLHVRRHF